MRNTLLIIIGLMAMLFGLNSCSMSKTLGFEPSMSVLQINLSDLEYLGQTEVSVEFSKVLGVFTIVNTINGKEYDGIEKHFALCADNNIRGLSVPELKYAFPKVYELFPNADYYMVVNQVSNNDILFLGTETKTTAKVKAYRFK